MRATLTAITAGPLSFAFAASAAAQSSPTLAKIKEEGVLRVAMADSPPSQSKNPGTGSWEGYNVDMAEDLARVLDVRLEIVDATWATLIPGLLAGQYDICMVDMFATPERAQTVVFTDAYNTLGYSFLVAGDAPYQDWEDLNDPEVTIATLSGTSGEPFVQQHLPQATMRSIVSDNNYAPHMEVMNGRADRASPAAGREPTCSVSEPPQLIRIGLRKRGTGVTLRLRWDRSPLTCAAVKVRIAGPDRIREAGRVEQWFALRHGAQIGVRVVLHEQDVVDVVGDVGVAFLNTWIRYIADSGQAERLRKKWFGF